MQVRRIVLGAAVLAATATAVSAVPALANASTASAQRVRIVNNAGLSGGQLAEFKHATGAVLNGSLRAHWHTPRIRWTSNPSSSWTIVFDNRLAPVQAFCGAGAAGCHDVEGGKPYAIVDTRLADTGRNWSLAGTHELLEMFVDPYLSHYTNVTGGSGGSWIDEVADPVEDLYHNVSGIEVSDFVYPAWYHNTTGQQDQENLIPYYGIDTFGFSCPSGYASYWLYGGWHGMGAGHNGSGCTLRNGSTPPLIGGVQLQHHPSAAIGTAPQGDRVAIFPMEH